MPVLHQEAHAMLLGLDRKGLGNLNQLDTADLKLESAVRAGVTPDPTRENEGRLLRQLGQLGKLLFPKNTFADHGLKISRAVANDQKLDLAARATIPEPSANRHILPHVPSDLLDIDGRHMYGLSSKVLEDLWCR